MRRALLLIGVALMLAMPAQASARQVPVVLLFHQGGFVGGADDMMESQAEALSEMGFKPVRVNYALGDLPGSVRDAKAAASRYGIDRTVVAYGESAGGGLAALLAARGRIDAAASYSGVNNMSKWFVGRDPLGASAAQLRRWSATARRSKSPILTYTTAGDPYVPQEPTRRWAHRDPLVTHRLVPGYHVADFFGDGAHADNVQDAAAWLRDRL